MVKKSPFQRTVNLLVDYAEKDTYVNYKQETWSF